MARRSCSGFFSTISCAMRTSVRRMSSPSRTSLSLLMAPSWPHGTGLRGSATTLAAAGAEAGHAGGDGAAARRSAISTMSSRSADAARRGYADARRPAAWAVDVVGRLSPTMTASPARAEGLERAGVDRGVGWRCAARRRRRPRRSGRRAPRPRTSRAAGTTAPLVTSARRYVAAQRVERGGGVLEGLVARAALLAEALAELGRELVVLRRPGARARRARRRGGTPAPTRAWRAARRRRPRSDTTAPPTS